MSNTSTAEMKLPYGWAAVVVRWILALLFFAAGVAKLTADPAMTGMFERWGLGPGWMYAAGVLECLGSILLVIPRVRIWGAAMLLAVMAGACIANAWVGAWMAVPAPLAGFLALLAVGVARPRRKSPAPASEESGAQPARG